MTEPQDQSQASLSGEWTDPQWVGSRPAAFGQLAPGDTVGRCKIVRELGMGGMGAVYLATHTTLQIDVALKILPPVVARERAEIAQRFIREAQLAARIRHLNVVSVMDADFDQSTGLYYIVLEYISGGSLAQRLRQGPLSEAETVGIIYDIAQALVIAAENKIVHRDIKPDNIMLDAKGIAKLADLGLAKQDFAAATAQLTQTGASVGTPSYMSPEQIRDAQNVDAQDDIYSLGVTLYECLTGATPYTAANPYNAVGQILFSPTPDPRSRRSDISPRLASICQKMMAKKKSDRYLNAQAIIEDLTALKSASLLGTLLSKRFNKTARGKKSSDCFYDQLINPRRKIKISELVIYFIILGVTVWVANALLRHDNTASSTIAAAKTPEAPNALVNPDYNSQSEPPSPRALPVDNTNSSNTTSEGATVSQTQTQAPPIALPPPEPIPGEEQTESNAAGAANVEAPISAFQAKALAEQMVDENVRPNLIKISGPRQAGNITPAYWRFLYWDPKADQHVRAVTVTGGVASPAKEGYVELGKLRVASYKQNEIIPSAKLKIDSAKALEIVRATPQLQNVPITSAAYFLDKGKGNLPPVWKLTLYTVRNSEEILLGDVSVLADTGLILEFGIKLNRLPTQP